MNALFDWLPVAIATVIFLGAATVYLRGSKDKGTIETLSRNNDALTERVEILEHEAEVKAAADAVNVERIVVLERENKVLQNIANSSAEIADLRAEMIAILAALRLALDTHHTQAMMGVAQIHDDLTAINENLGGRKS